MASAESEAPVTEPPAAAGSAAQADAEIAALLAEPAPADAPAEPAAPADAPAEPADAAPVDAPQDAPAEPAPADPPPLDPLDRPTSQVSEVNSSDCGLLYLQGLIGQQVWVPHEELVPRPWLWELFVRMDKNGALLDGSSVRLTGCLNPQETAPFLGQR